MYLLPVVKTEAVLGRKGSARPFVESGLRTAVVGWEGGGERKKKKKKDKGGASRNWATAQPGFAGEDRLPGGCGCSGRASMLR